MRIVRLRQAQDDELAAFGYVAAALAIRLIPDGERRRP